MSYSPLHLKRITMMKINDGRNQIWSMISEEILICLSTALSQTWTSSFGDAFCYRRTSPVRTDYEAKSWNKNVDFWWINVKAFSVDVRIDYKILTTYALDRFSFNFRYRLGFIAQGMNLVQHRHLESVLKIGTIFYIINP